MEHKFKPTMKRKFKPIPGVHFFSGKPYTNRDSPQVSASPVTQIQPAAPGEAQREPDTLSPGASIPAKLCTHCGDIAHMHCDLCGKPYCRDHARENKDPQLGGGVGCIACFPALFEGVE